MYIKALAKRKRISRQTRGISARRMKAFHFGRNFLFDVLIHDLTQQIPICGI